MLTDGSESFNQNIIEIFKKQIYINYFQTF